MITWEQVPTHDIYGNKLSFTEMMDEWLQMQLDEIHKEEM